MNGQRGRLSLVLIFAAIIALLALLSATCVSATAYTSCPGGSEYPAFHAAMDATDHGAGSQAYATPSSEGDNYDPPRDPDGWLTSSCGCVGATQTFLCGETITESCTLNCDLSTNGTCFVIGADHITVSGAGHGITGNSTGNGIELSGRTNVTIRDLSICNFTNGIFMETTVYSTVHNVTATNNRGTGGCGIYFSGANGNTISECEASGNAFTGLYMESGSTHNNVTNCTANSNWYYGIVLWSSSNNNTLQNSTVSDNERGIALGYSNANAIHNNTLRNNSLYGLEMQQPSNNNAVSNNAIDNNEQYGIYIGTHGSYYSGNRIIGNTITNNNYGLYTMNATNTTIEGNCITNNSHGLRLEESAHNLIVGNTIETYSGTGISLYHNSPHNRVQQNKVSGGESYSGNIGISLDWAHHTVLTGNRVANNRGWGMYIGGTSQYAIVDQNEIVHNEGYGGTGIGITSSRNNVTNNTVSWNDVGLSITNDGYENVIGNNTIGDNNDWGIDLWSADNNTINHNTILSNGKYGVRIFEYSTHNILSENVVCQNGISDFYLDGTPPGNSGHENTCGSPDGWTDEGATGCTFGCEAYLDFDTEPGTYPSIAGTHNGTITPFWNITVCNLYTYSCPGTGGHTEYVKIWKGATPLAEKTWSGYPGDWHTITFDESFILYENETYNYTIRTGSYPQIIHAPEYNATGGTITCTDFVDGNGQQHEGWIPAIRLF